MDLLDLELGGKNLPVNVKHAKGLDAILSQDALLASVHVAQTNVHQLLDAQAHVLLNPAKAVLLVLLGNAREESNRHAVDVAAVAGLGGVDVGVRINPDDGNFAVQTLTSSLGGAGNGANGNAVVAAEGQREAALGRVLVCLGRNLSVDGRHKARVLHAAVVRVGGGRQVVVELDRLVAVQLVAKLLSDLGQESRLDEGGRARIDTSFLLLRSKSVF